MTSRMRGRAVRALLLGAAAVLGVCIVPAEVSARTATDDAALAVVNGDTIRSSDVDSLVVRTHRTMDAAQRTRFEYRKLLDKLVNDRLILQEAEALGLEEEPEIREALRAETDERSMRCYLAERFPKLEPVPEEAVRAEFDRYYWRIQVRQVSARSREEAERLAAEVRAGASMDSIAREISVDVHRFRGGLHNLKFWADVENDLRGPLKGAKVGDVVGPIPVRDSYAVVRVEQIAGVDTSAYAAYAPKLRGHLQDAARERARRSFLAELESRDPIRIDAAIVARITADSAVVLRGEFLKDETDPVLTTQQGRSVTAGELRREISHAAMRRALAPFDSLLRLGIESKRERLLLSGAAERAGCPDRPEVRAKVSAKRDEMLIQTYLHESVISKIVFERAEIEEYLSAHADEFRGPEQFRLGTIVVETEAEAREIADRLSRGADFRRVKQQVSGSATALPEETKWVALEIFSDEIRAALQPLLPGQTSPALEAGEGWLVAQVHDRRPGPVQSFEEAEGAIRRVLFQKKFNELLDAHLAVLKNRSRIEMFEDRIEAYFGS